MRSTAIGPSTASAPKRARAAAQKPRPRPAQPRRERGQRDRQEAVVARDRLAPGEQQRAHRDAAGRQRHHQRPRAPDREEQVADRHEERDRAGGVEQAQLAARAGAARGRTRCAPSRTRPPTPASARRGCRTRRGRPRTSRSSGIEQVGEEAAEVDDEVERLVDGAQAEPVAAPELIADVRRHARLDPARADRDQRRGRSTRPRWNARPAPAPGCRRRRRATARGWCGTCPAGDRR